MELFFGSYRADNDTSALVSFVIPEIGIHFKAPIKAEKIALDYASLLALLEFVEVNPQLFANKALEICCNSYDLIAQVESCTTTDLSLAPLLRKALTYRRKLNYSLRWVPRNDNPADRVNFD
jgi:hypothetical protein